MEVRVTPWGGPKDPREDELRSRLEREGLHSHAWSNGPLESYAPHSHRYDKVIYVVSGSITFGLPEDGRRLGLGPGDRLELPAGTLHDAQVGEAGVVCLEAHSN